MQQFMQSISTITAITASMLEMFISVGSKFSFGVTFFVQPQKVILKRAMVVPGTKWCPFHSTTSVCRVFCCSTLTHFCI